MGRHPAGIPKASRCGTWRSHPRTATLPALMSKWTKRLAQRRIPPIINTGVPRSRSANQCPRQAASVMLFPNAPAAVALSPPYASTPIKVSITPTSLAGALAILSRMTAPSTPIRRQARANTAARKDTTLPKSSGANGAPTRQGSGCRSQVRGPRGLPEPVPHPKRFVHGTLLAGYLHRACANQDELCRPGQVQRSSSISTWKAGRSLEEEPYAGSMRRSSRIQLRRIQLRRTQLRRTQLREPDAGPALLVRPGCRSRPPHGRPAR